MPAWRMPANCERCGAVHNPWRVHAGQGETRYEIWAAETGSVESTLAVDRDAGVSASEARMRFASQLERFLEEDPPPRLWESTVMVPLGFDADSESGLGMELFTRPYISAAPSASSSTLRWTTCRVVHSGTSVGVGS
jgi:hypothetical protein